MLSLLEIKNIALIDHAKIDFCSGLNVLSGETGAGKSVIIESLNFVLGAKAEKTLIKSGETECFVRAEFENIPNKEIAEILKDYEIDYDDALIITRKLNDQGKGIIKVNGVTVTLSMLKNITSLLVDVHGQSEHFYLLKESNQLSLIDNLGKDKVTVLKDRVNKSYVEFKMISSELEKLGGSEKDRETRLDIINYQIDEIQALDLKEGEEEELLTVKQRLNNIEKIQSALSTLKESVDGEGGISDILYNVSKSVASISGLDGRYRDIFERLDVISNDLSDISSSASDYIDELSENNFDIDYVEDRLDRIKSIKRKYGNTYSNIMEYLDSVLKEKDILINFNDTYKNLLENLQIVKKQLYDECSALSCERKNVAKLLSENILKELLELGITKGKFEVKFSDAPDFDLFDGKASNGFDRIEFLFSANPGQPLKPLSQVISGGEMSRFMLAVKSQTAASNELSTFVFDEIDAGISGNIAKVVARKFARIAKNVQVIAITHLPQISVMADRNILIYKTESDNDTLTNVSVLSEDEKTLEIIRLIGGTQDSTNAKKHALELIDEATEFKKTL